MSAILASPHKATATAAKTNGHFACANLYAFTVQRIQRADRPPKLSNKKNTGTAWSDDEIQIIVEDYLRMLQSELAGEAFNKAERNRALQSRN